MGKKKTRNQAYRAAALEAALDAMAKAGRVSGAERIELDPDNVLRYAKFILGKEKRSRAIGRAYVDILPRKREPVRAYAAEAGTPLPDTYPPGEPWKPLGYPTEDGLKEDPEFSVADVFRKKAPAETAPQPLTLSAMDLDRAVRDLREKAARGALAADPDPVKAADGIDLRGIRTRWDAERNVQRGVYPAMPGVRHEDADVAQLDEGNAAGCEECAAELERRGLTDLGKPDPWETSSPALCVPVPLTDEEFSRPVGEDPGDREVLTQWAETIRQQDAAREAAREAAALESEPEAHKPEDGLTITKEDGTRFVVLDANASSADKRLAEETMGLVPGALDEELTITNEGTFLPDGSPAEKALREDLSVKPAPMFHSAAFSEKAPDHVLKEGKDAGCPECAAEADRRRERDVALERGREKLRDRLTTMEQRNTDRVDPLDEDELLAVAGSELYPAGDEEPSREVKIRNRKGEVRSYASGASNSPGGWTVYPDNPWMRREVWTSSEMDRRGPWHVV